jgi:hypothetical protein
VGSDIMLTMKWSFAREFEALFFQLEIPVFKLYEE